MTLALAWSCQPASNHSASSTEQESYSPEDYEFLAIGNPDSMSAASKRALENGYHRHEEWFGHFSVEPLRGDFAYEKGVIRRDPTMVIQVDGLYHVWYTKSTGPGLGFETGDPEKKTFPWDKSEVWHATSKDGWDWKEEGVAVTFGPKGAYDDRSVFTPEILVHEGKYYLVYQCVKAPYLRRVFNTVGMSISDSPEGPWQRLEAPILEPARDGEWLGEEDDRFAVKKQGSFDSHKVHDPTLLFYRDKFYLYYKGERMGERLTAGGREIRWGVAIADKIEGPYLKSPYNPITQSGHEIAIWPYKGGIALVHCDDGPEKETFQYSPDGINFEIMAYVDDVPPAIGMVTTLDNEQHPTAALEWGLSHKSIVPPGKDWMSGDNQIMRFSFTPNQRTQEAYRAKYQ